MPDPYFGQALAAGEIGANLLALPNTIEQNYQQAVQNRRLLESLAPSFGITPAQLEQMAPMPSMQHFPGMNVPVLGSVLRGIGTTGQLLQTVLGNAPAPRPPLAELGLIAKARQEERQTEESRERTVMAQERLGLERQRTEAELGNFASLRSHRLWQESKPSGGTPKSYVVGGGGTTQDGTAGVDPPTASGGSVTVEGGITPQEFAEYKRRIQQQVRSGQMRQEDADAQLFGLQQAMTTPAGVQNATPPSTQGSTPEKPASGIRYGQDQFNKLDRSVATMMTQNGVDPRNFGADDVAKARADLAKGKVQGAQDLQQVKQQALTAATKTMREAAPSLVERVNRAEQALSKVTTGPLASRYQEAMTGKIGAANPDFMRYRTDVDLVTTLLMRMHVGARGSEGMLAHFQNMLNAGIQSPENMHAALEEIREYAQDVGNLTPSTPGAATGSPGMQTTPGGNAYRILEP